MGEKEPYDDKSVSHGKCAECLRKQDTGWKHFYAAWCDFCYLLYTKLSLVTLLFLGVFYCQLTVVKSDSNTWDITKGALAVLLSLAAVSFSWVRAIDGKTIRIKIAYAGQLFFHGALLLLTAALLKYLITNIPEGMGPTESQFILTGLKHYLYIFPPVLFLYSLLISHSALSILSKILWERLPKGDWDKIVH